MRIIAFASFSGGSGCTTVAMAAARELCRFRNRKVLYLSMEDVESTEDYFTDMLELVRYQKQVRQEDEKEKKIYPSEILRSCSKQKPKFKGTLGSANRNDSCS